MANIRILTATLLTKFSLSSELCGEKAMVAYIRPQKRKKEEGEKLRREKEIRSSLLILDLKDGRL